MAVRRFLVVAVGSLVSASFAVSAPILSSGASAEPSSGVVTPGVSFAATDQVIVQLQPGRRADAAALGRAAGTTVSVVREQAGGAVVLKLPSARSGAALQATVGAMARVPGVAWAEPDVWMTAVADRSGEQWDMGPVGSVYGIDATSAWPALPADAASTVVAVADTGYLPHPDLAGVLLGDGYDFVSDARIGNDGDGRDTDAADPGDWITSAESRRGFFRGCSVGNSSWHGTHVAGTIGARHDGDGINGVDARVRILPVRVLGKCGGYTSDITDGVRWAAGLAVSGADANPTPAKVVNLSLGGGGACSSTWQTAIDDVVAAGTTVVVAAGNSSADAGGYSPAGCDGVITVASTGKAGRLAYYSNFGSTVEISAPGGDKNADAGDTILSTLNSGTTAPDPGGYVYVKYQGTSMATPHVAGVASLVLSARPDLTPADVVAIIEQSATAFPAGGTCSTSNCGAGIANAAAAVALARDWTSEPPPPPPPPADLPGAFNKTGPADGTSGFKGGVTLAWDASTGATEYWICLDTTLDRACSDFTYGPYTGTSIKFVGLAKSTTYEWDVEARNGAGSTRSGGGVWRFTTR